MSRKVRVYLYATAGLHDHEASSVQEFLTAHPAKAFARDEVAAGRAARAVVVNAEGDTILRVAPDPTDGG